MRPSRIEYPGALYHVTSRGNRRKRIYNDDRDRYAWLVILGSVCNRYNVVVHAFCQMSNHYHLMLETVDGNLAQAMGSLNARYAQHFNRRHKLPGHVMQGRYHAILVQKDTYLLECARYVVLNPVRAGMVELPGDWPWSSYNYMLADCEVEPWLDRNWLLNHFGTERSAAQQGFRDFVYRGIKGNSPFANTRHRIILGDDAFVWAHGKLLRSMDPQKISRDQRKMLAVPLPDYRRSYSNRDEAMARAYHSTMFTMSEIASYFGVHPQTVSRAVHHYAKSAERW